MYIVAIAWGYVVLMMSITEETIVAGVMTLALYGILPLTIILYIMGTGGRKRRRAANDAAAALARTEAATSAGVIEPTASAEVAVPDVPATDGDAHPGGIQKPAP